MRCVYTPILPGFSVPFLQHALRFRKTASCFSQVIYCLVFVAKTRMVAHLPARRMNSRISLAMELDDEDGYEVAV